MDFTARAAGIGTLADETRRALYEYVAAQPDAVTREASATAVGVPPHMARFHLDKLVEAGLLETEFRRMSGRTGPGAGRPSKLYRRTTGTVSVSLPERRYDLAGHVLAGAIERAAEGTPLPDAVAEVAHAEGQAIAASAPPADDADARLTAVLTDYGYEPREQDGAVILANCPFDSLARDHTALICSANLSLVGGVLEGLGCAHLRALGEPHAGQCCVAIRPHRGPHCEGARYAEPVKNNRRRPARPGRSRPAAPVKQSGAKGKPSQRKPATQDSSPAPVDEPPRSFRLGVIPGATPGKWVDAWKQRMPHVEIELVSIAVADQRSALEDLDAALVRLPIAARDDLHVIPLYDEVPVVVAAADSYLLAAEELTAQDLAGQVLVTPADDVLGRIDAPTVAPDFPPVPTTEDAIATVASGVGIAIVPMSLARLHHRKDAGYRPLVDGPTSTVALAWPREATTPDVETFVGIVRGRTANSSR